ncbi:MAG: PAS domain S-box protein [Desulfomonilaceae bacterium]|nr:PAS domain S-box protein [Desulfomonilaceae bacterium]
MAGPTGAKTYLAVTLGILFAVLSIVVIFLVNGTMRQLALNDAGNAARMLLDHNLAVHTYFSQNLKPKLFEKLAPIASKEYFEPVWMSSTYAVREIDKYFRHFNPNPYYYKESAINARSPENEADGYEKAFLEALQNNPELTTKSAIRVLDGKPYFTLLRRGETMEESCLRCHSSPEKAPGDMVRQYGPHRSFNRKVDDTAQAISIRIPLSEAFSGATDFSYLLSGLLLTAFGGGFLVVWFGGKRLMLDPIAAIRDRAVQIASDPNRLGESIAEPKARELHDLVGAFNQMSVALRKSYDELEQRVVERTKELATERERLAVTLRSIGDGVIVTDTEGRITALNRETENLTGWTEEEALGRPLEEVFVIVNEKTRTPCENPVHKVLQTGEVVGLANNTLLLAKDGSERILADSAAPIRAEDGEVWGVALVFRDVTERVRAEEELKKSEALLKEAQRVAHIGHWELGDPSGAPTWSEEIFHIFGLDPVLGEPSFAAHRDMIHAEDWALLDRAVRRLSAEGEPYDIEFRVIRPDGSVRWMNAKGYAGRNEQNETVRLFGTAQDITDRKKTEEALARSESRLSTAVTMAHLGHWEYDVVKDLFTFNDHFYRMFRTTAEQVGGYTMSSADYARRFVHPDDMALVKEETQKAIESNDPYFSRQLEHRILYADGEIGHISVKYFVVKDELGRTVKTYGVNQDITERKKSEQERENLLRQLAQAQKMEAVGTLTGGIAHDFNNLLTIINGYTELILLEKSEDDPIYPDLMKILETGRKGAELVQRLLALSRKGKVNPESLDLNRVIEESVALMKRTFPKMIEIDTSLDKELSMVNADASQIEQVLMNLCVNAKDAMPNGGRIGIRTKNILLGEENIRERPEAKTGRYVLMEISDTGSGISAEIIERVFEPFFTTKGWDFKKGTGLGLPVAKGIVEQHSGWITCRSEEGKGTAFSVYLPAIGEESDLGEPKMEESSPTGKKILLVDDEEFVRDLGRRILERAGYTVITASGGKEALEICKRARETIGLVILDLMMPQMGGEECLDELLRIDPHLKVIVSTGHSLTETESSRLGTRARGFVNKPYEVEQLVRVVREVL